MAENVDPTQLRNIGSRPHAWPKSRFNRARIVTFAAAGKRSMNRMPLS
jgi:hypothetical protein